MDKKELAQRLLNEAAAENNAFARTGVEAELQRREAERQRAVSEVDSWVEQSRRGLGAFARGQMAVKGKIRLLDGEAVTDTETAPVQTTRAVNQHGLPTCHSRSTPGPCENWRAFNLAATDYACHQCGWRSTNAEFQVRGRYE